MAHCRKLAYAVQKEMRRRVLRTLKEARESGTRARKLNKEVFFSSFPYLPSLMLSDPLPLSLHLSD